MAEQTPQLNLHQKLVEIRKSIGGFTKDAQGYGYKYVSGSQVLAKIQDKMNELGVLLVPKIQSQQFEKHAYVNSKGKDALDFLVYGEMTYTWVDADNPEDTLEVPFYYTGAQDDISKAFGSGLTYSERYFVIKFFNLPTDADDPDKRDTSGRSGYNRTPQYQQAPVQQQQHYPQPQYQQQQQHQQQAPQGDGVTPNQLKALGATLNDAAKRTRMDKDAVAEYARIQLNIPSEISSKELTKRQASQMIDFLKNMPDAQ